MTGLTRKRRISDLALLDYAALVGSSDYSVGSKIKKLMKRNRIRNASLYELSEDMEGSEYIVCPVLGIRTLNIRRTYMENVLGITVDEFTNRYPNAKLTCDGHSRRIATGLSAEIEPGITRHATSVVNATVTRATVGEDGLSINQRKGTKTRDTHMQHDENGLNGYQRLAHYRNTTFLENGLSIQQNSLSKRFDNIDGLIFRRKASKLSKVKLKPILNLLDDYGIIYYFDTKEYCLGDYKKHFYFDLVIPVLNICVEYQSNAFHPNPFWTSHKWNAWINPFNTTITPEQKLDYDLNKAKYLWREQSIRTWFVWQDTDSSDVDTIIEYLRDINVQCK